MSDSPSPAASRRRVPRPGRRSGVPVGAVLAGLLLSGCAAADGTAVDGAGEEVVIPTEPIDAVTVSADPPSPAALSGGAGAVTFSWTGLLAGEPVTHEECVGMVALTSPKGHLVHFDPSLRECSGQTVLPLDATTTVTGDYRLNVMLNGLNTTIFYPVLP